MGIVVPPKPVIAEGGKRCHRRDGNARQRQQVKAAAGHRVG